MFLLSAMTAIFTGFLLVSQRLINAGLGLRLGSLQSSFANHFIGALLAALLLLFGLGRGHLHIDGVPLYYFLGGCIGFFAVYLINLSIARMGAMTTSICLVFSQLLTSTVIDHYGLLGAFVIKTGPTRVMGISLILCGAVFASKKTKVVSKSVGGVLYE